MAGNSATIAGGGIFNHGAFGSPPIALHNSIVANNSAASGPDLGGAFASAFSLVRSTAGSTFTETVPGSNVIGQDPLLGPLESNGGPTQTMKPIGTSPAVDKGAAFGLSTDERGAPRPFVFPTIPNSTAAGADGSDIGAFELQPSDVPPNGFRVGKVKGTKLTLTLDSAGAVQITDATSPLSAAATAAKKKKSLKPSSASGGPGKLKVALRLTKAAAKKLRQAGKLKLKASITFTPTGGVPDTKTAKLKLK